MNENKKADIGAAFFQTLLTARTLAGFSFAYVEREHGLEQAKKNLEALQIAMRRQLERVDAMEAMHFAEERQRVAGLMKLSPEG